MSPTPEEEETIADVIEEQGADRLNNWVRVDPDQDLVETDDEVLVQWESDDGDLAVVVTRDVRDEGEVYNVRAQAIGDDVPFSKRHPVRWEGSLETALDEGIIWLRNHRPGVPFPTFSMRIEGGIIKPLADLIRRFGGQKVLLEVRDDSIVVESMSHVNAVEFRITTADMESLEVEQEGEAVTDSGFLWDALKPVNFSDTVPVSMDGDQDRPRLQVASQSTTVSVSADFLRRNVPGAFPFDARFTVPGLEYRDKIRGLGVIDAEDTVFGVRDGVAFLRAVSDDGSDEVTGRFDATEVEGEQVVVVATDRLQDLRRAVPRPSQTPITFSFPGNDPLLAEYTVSETDVDVRIALKTGAVPREVELPPEEVVVPEGATVPTDEPEGEGEFPDVERALERSAPGVEASVEEDLEGFTVTLTPDANGVQFVDDSEIEVTGQDLGFAIGKAFERWELAVDQRTIPYDDIEGERREARQDVDVTIPRFPITDDETTRRVSVEGVLEEFGDKHISVGAERIIPEEEREAVMDELRERLGQDVIDALIDATPRGSGNVIAEVTWVRDELDEIDLEEERIEELVSEVEGVEVPWETDDGEDDGVDAALEEAVEEMDESHEDKPDAPDDGARTQVSLIPDEWTLLLEALALTAAHASERDNATAAITIKEIHDDLDAQESVVRELAPEEWATAVEVARFIAFEGEHGGVEPSFGEDMGKIADKLEDKGVGGDIEPEVAIELEPPEDGSDEPTGTDEGVIELRITVEEALGGRLVYAPPPNSVSLGVSEEIDNEAEDRLGPAGRFSGGQRVGTAFVTDDEQATDRELLRVEVQESLLPDDEEEEDEREVPPEEEMEPESGSTSITVSLIGGTPNYVVRGTPPNEVEDEAITAAIEALGQPGSFEIGDTVGHIEYTDTTINTFDFEQGQELLMERDDDEEGEGEVGEEGELKEGVVFVDETPSGATYMVQQTTLPPDEVAAVREQLGSIIGPPGQFDDGQKVATVAITPEDDLEDREFVSLTVEEGVEGEPGGVDDEVPEGFGVTVEDTFSDEVIEAGELEEEIEDVEELSKSQVEVIVEGATIGITVQARTVEGRLIDIILDIEHASPISFTTDVGEVKTIMGDTRRESVLNAIDRWEGIVRIGSLSDGQVASVNEARLKLNDQFALNIPLLEPSDIEGFSVGDVRDIMEESVAGVGVEVNTNPDADSLRIRMEPDADSDVAFTGSLQEIQGAVSNPAGAIRDALEEWRENVDLATVDVDAVNRARTRVEKRFDLNLPRVEGDGDGMPRTGDRREILDVWESLTQDMETVEVDEGQLVQQGGYAIPVEIDHEFASFADEEGKTQIEQGLLIHHTDEVHDEVHAILARALDSEPEDFYDGSKPSELEDYDLFYRFTLTRNTAPGPWTNPRFAPSTLFKLLQPVDGDRIQVVSRGEPLA